MTEKKKIRKSDPFEQLAGLFFETRQIIRDNLEDEKPDPNAWMRYETLRYIANAQNPTMQDVAKYLRVKAPSATSLVARLERQGWLVRERGTADKRVVRISLSKKGTQVLTEHLDRSRTVMRRVFSKLPERDVRLLAELLERVGRAHRS